MDNEPKYLPDLEVNFGLSWKVTFTLKGFSEKRVYKNNEMIKITI